MITCYMDFYTVLGQRLNPGNKFWPTIGQGEFDYFVYNQIRTLLDLFCESLCLYCLDYVHTAIFMAKGVFSKYRRTRSLPRHRECGRELVWKLYLACASQVRAAAARRLLLLEHTRALSIEHWAPAERWALSAEHWARAQLSAEHASLLSNASTY